MNVTPAWKDAYRYDEAIVYLLDADLRIVRCNPAWDRFAIANSGEDAVSSKVIGCNVMDVVPAALRDFYLIAYDNVRKAGRDWWHIFECSSPSMLRRFQMRILPTHHGGVVTVNTLIAEEPASAGEPRADHEYSSEDRVVTMCSHCRRVQRLHRPDIWDWVPELLLRGRILARPGLCNFCEAYHSHRR